MIPFEDHLKRYEGKTPPPIPTNPPPLPRKKESYTAIWIIGIVSVLAIVGSIGEKSEKKTIATAPTSEAKETPEPVRPAAGQEVSEEYFKWINGKMGFACQQAGSRGVFSTICERRAFSTARPR